MKNRTLTFSALLATALVWSGVVFATSTKCEAVELIDGAEAYNEIVCKGVEFMDEENYEKAIVEFNKALDVRLHEVPNFNLYPRLALAYFLNGNDVKANENLAKAELSLSVLFGIVECIESDSGFELRRNGRWKVDSIYREEMTQRMCGAAYEYVYEERTLESVLKDSELLEHYMNIKKRLEN